MFQRLSIPDQMMRKEGKEHLRCGLLSPPLTGVIQCCGQAGGGLLGAELGHTAVSLHGERVVEMSVQVGDHNQSVLQAGGAWFKADLVPTGDTLPPVAVLTQHAVCEVAASPGHQRRAPRQLQPPLS